VIVDGIDEASDLREVIVDLVLRQLYDRGHTVVATSRPEGVQRADGSLINPELGEIHHLGSGVLDQEATEAGNQGATDR